MFKRFSSQLAPTDTQPSRSSVQDQRSQVIEPPQQPYQPVQQSTQEPMDTSLPQAASAIKKRLKGIKGTASITPSTIKAIVSPSPPLPQPLPQSESPLQRLKKDDYGTEDQLTFLHLKHVQLFKSIVFIEEKDLPVGGRVKWFEKQRAEKGSHPFQVDLIRQGYQLPFRDHPKLSRNPCIISGYIDIDKENALSTFILN